MNKNTLEVLVGCLVIFIACLFAYYVYNQTHQTDKNAQHAILYAKFDKADGINLGSDIRLAGIKIGKILELKLDDKTYQAVVKLGIDMSVPLPLDSSVEIISNGLLGEKYLSIMPGASDEYLKDGATLEFTQSSISLESLIGKFIFGDSKKPNDKK